MRAGLPGFSRRIELWPRTSSSDRLQLACKKQNDYEKPALSLSLVFILPRPGAAEQRQGGGAGAQGEPGGCPGAGLLGAATAAPAGPRTGGTGSQGGPNFPRLRLSPGPARDKVTEPLG